MITCFIKYQLNLEKLAEFRKYTEIWIDLVKKHGGIHYGCFLPDDGLDDKLNMSFSFPSIGKVGDKHTAVALFSFATIDDYQQYREAVKTDPQCLAATQLANDSNCFISYERNFLKYIFSNSDLNRPTIELAEVKEQLSLREPIFHRPGLGTTRNDFENMITADFWEVSASGQVYSREFAINTMLERYQDPTYIENDIWRVTEFECQKISANNYLVTYLLSQGKQKRLTRRSTLWKWENDYWKAKYHQGTVISVPVVSK